MHCNRGSRFIVAGALQMIFLYHRSEKASSFQKSSNSPWYSRNALIVVSYALAAGMGLVGVASQIIGSGLIASFIAAIPMRMAVIGLALGIRPSKLEIIGMLIGFCGVIFLVQGKAFSVSTVGLQAMFGATFSQIVSLYCKPPSWRSH